MGTITIFNTISAVILGAIGFAVATPFGSDSARWGAVIGGVFGFLFPRYPFGLIVWIVERFHRPQIKRQDDKHEDANH